MADLTTLEAGTVGQMRSILAAAEAYPENYPDHFVSVHLDDLRLLLRVITSLTCPTGGTDGS